MNEKHDITPSPGLGKGDILFVLFRHKWKIILLSLAAIGGSAALYFFWPVPYQSEAKLFVKYVVEKAIAQDPTANGPKVKIPDERGGEAVVNNEVEILMSLDLAQQVAVNLTPDMLTKLAGETNVYKATLAIYRGLSQGEPPKGKTSSASALPKSDVIRVVFAHRNPDVVQPILKQLIEIYLNRQAEIHRAVGQYDDYLSKQRDALRARLSTTKEDLRKAKEKIGIISLEDSKKLLSDEMAKLEAGILEASAELEEGRAKVSALGKLLATEFGPDSGLVATSSVAAATNPPAATNPLASVPQEKIDEYRRALLLLDALSKREQDLRSQFVPGSRMMKGLEAQIADAEKQKQRLEKENPGLLAGKLEETRPLGPGAAPRELGPRLEYITQAAKVPALESRIRTLTNQLNAVHAQAVAMSDAEGAISDLELTRQMQETQYTYFQRALDELRADEQLGVVRNSNVIPIQTPSPPFLDKVKLLKVALVVLIGGLGCAFGLAFLSEFYLDQSLKRPSEVEARLRLPVFVAIPRLRLNRKGGRRELEAGPAPLLPEQTPSAADTSPPAPDAGSAAPGTPHSTAVALWNPHYAMRPFEDALRDRLITYFDLRNMTHKPKLVALTSCGEGSGVTTIATGLAASMSETGEGSVLLVDMNEDGSMHEFYRGNPSCGLEDALELEKRDTAMVRDNLYVVKEHGDGTKAPRSLPKHFQHLVPKLKASDYDYVIFDLPPISQVSVTSKLARFMDINLIVVEAEHTDREVVRRASAYLAETGASVGVVLNKRRSYGPRRLQQDV